MNIVAQPSTGREFDRHVANELSDIWQEVIAASPRDQIEFGAKAFGFSGEAGSSEEGQIGPAKPPTHVVLSRLCPSPPVSASLDIIRVTRGAKADWTSIRPGKVMPPKGSLEWIEVTEKRISSASAGFSVVTMGCWVLALLHAAPNSNPDWGTVLAAILLMVPALYGLFFFLIDWAFGSVSGSTAMARKYMDQVYPPRKRGEN